MEKENINPSAEIRQLTETNEALLRSKGRLQNEIIELKKQIVDQKRNAQLIEELQSKIAALNLQVSEHVLTAALLSTENQEFKKQVSSLTLEIQKLTTENIRLQKLDWFKRLLGKK